MELKTLALVATVLLAASTFDSVNQTDFTSFKATQGKTYASEQEESYRQAIFNKNLEMINAHNADETQTYEKGINQFSDWTQEEFESIMLSPRSSPIQEEGHNEPLAEVGNVNWVTQGAVTGVKNQGSCGSCWAFGAAGACESMKFHNTGTLGLFSEQQLVSCDRSGRNRACQGGFEYDAMRWYAANGICTQASYPYTSGGGSVAACRMSSCTKDSFRVTGYQIVKGVSQLQSANNVRVMAVAVNASGWNSYRSGIFSNCGTQLNHAVLLAGYTSSYWLVKNSWGASWGESGYIRLLGNRSTCGIADDASYPTT